MKAYRQGELLFVPQEIKDVGSLERTLEKRPRLTVIAEGESSGHKHELKDPETAVLVDSAPDTWIDNSNPLYNNYQKILHTDSGTVIRHPDHEDLELPEGTYFIRSQREYDETTSRRVVD